MAASARPVRECHLEPLAAHSVLELVEVPSAITSPWSITAI